MSHNGLWTELKRRRVVRVVVTYGAVAIGVLEVAQLTFEPLGIPEWTYAFLVFAALAGFPVAVALSWALERTTDGIRLDSPSEAGSARLRGRFVVGCAVAIATLLGIWRFGTGGLGADVRTDGPGLTAVVPFSVTSADPAVRVLGQGIVDLLTPVLSPSTRVVDEGRVVAEWQRRVGDDGGRLSESQSIELAQRLGAAQVVVGTMVETGERLVVNARLLRVPGGEEVGRASVESAPDKVLDQLGALAAQVLSLEAGVVEERIDALAGVPIEAARLYLEGRRAYRRGAAFEARGLFARALDIDSTFALAALRLREASGMTLDMRRITLSARADRLIRAHPRALPPGDLRYYQLWIGDGERRRSGIERMRDARTLAGERPYKPEAWYLRGDEILHDAFRTRGTGFRDESREAFARALALDPGFVNVIQHRLFDAAFYDDVEAVRTLAPALAGRTAGSESATLANTLLGYLADDSEVRERMSGAVDTLPMHHLRYMTYVHGLSGTALNNDEADALFERLAVTSTTEADRADVANVRYRYLMSAGRVSEAGLLVGRGGFPAAAPEFRLYDHLYWDGPGAAAASAAAELSRALEGGGPLPWDFGGAELCVLGVWSLRNGAEFALEPALSRLDEGSDDPWLEHGQNAICAALWRAMVAEREGDAGLAEQLDVLTTAMDRGVYDGGVLVARELSRMLAAMGRTEEAARVAGYLQSSVPFPLLRSTAHREAGRLWDQVGDSERAGFHFRRFVRMRPDPDPHLRPQVDSIRARLREIDPGGTER